MTKEIDIINTYAAVQAGQGDVDELAGNAFGDLKKVCIDCGFVLPEEVDEHLKRFANAYAATIALLVCADLEVETEETLAAINFIRNDSCLQKNDLVSSTLEYYGNFIKELSESFSEETSYLLKKASILEEHINVDLSNSYKKDIKSLCNALIGNTANNKERSVCNEILAIL